MVAHPTMMETESYPPFDDLVLELSSRYRTFRLVLKDTSPFMKLIYYGTFMFFWCPRFGSDYTTTILARVYMPRHLVGTPDGYVVLRHEEVHIKDCFRFGVVPFALSYLFLLPSVFTLRAIWEMRAFKATIRAFLEVYGEIPDARLDRIQDQFTSSSYFWMCPFPGYVRPRLEAFREKLLSEHEHG